MRQRAAIAHQTSQWGEGGSLLGGEAGEGKSEKRLRDSEGTKKVMDSWKSVLRRQQRKHERIAPRPARTLALRNAVHAALRRRIHLLAADESRWRAAARQMRRS